VPKSCGATHHRTRRPIALADAVLLATATSGDRIATSDRDVLAVAGELGIAVEKLPDQG
jgi:predicted nucleic acid-binding protein